MEIQDIVNYLESVEIIIAISVAVIGFIYSLFKWLIPTYKAFKRHMNTVDRISEEFRPNGGSSIKDAINRLEVSNADIKEDNKQIKHDIHIVKIESQKVGAKQWALVATQKDPVFETDHIGKCNRINVMYANLFERGYDELRNSGWENGIHPDDRVVVFREWEDAVKKHKSFESSFRIVGAISGKVYKVVCVANPYFNTSGELLGYIGRYVHVEQIV